MKVYLLIQAHFFHPRRSRGKGHSFVPTAEGRKMPWKERGHSSQQFRSNNLSDDIIKLSIYSFCLGKCEHVFISRSCDV
ncbi:hypothetical protein RDABS01_001296 [Bienertia sinuspersici]